MNVFNIQPFSTGDGRGIRTTVFMGGCNLRCPWCHNPECFSNKRTVSLAEVEKRILHDRAYYEASDGGVTLSGGEPLLNFGDCMALLEVIKKNGLNVCIDTALSVNIPDFNKAVSLTDCFLVDLKTAEPQKFKEVCGGDFRLYERNVSTLTDMGAEVVYRIPLIPGFNTDETSVTQMISFILKYPHPVSFHPFHKLGMGKYKELGMTCTYAETPLLTEGEIRAVKSSFLACGITEASL